MNRGKDIGLTLISLAFLAMGIFLLVQGDPEDRLMAIGVTAFFGACALVGLMQLIPSERITLDTDGGFTIKPDRIQMLGMAVGALGMAAGCAIFAPIAANEGRQVVALAGYAGTLFFGLGGLFLVWRALTEKPLARIDRYGVRTFGPGAWSFAWREIGGIQIMVLQGQPVLSFEPDTVDILPNSSLGYTIGVRGSRLKFEDLQAIVHDLWRSHRDASAPAALQH